MVIFRIEALKNTEFCQKMAIKDCTAHLSEIFQALEQKTRSFEKCAEFQEVINCLSVPRCFGDLLSSFRSLLIATASLMKESNLCPGLKYSDLKKYVKGDLVYCNDTNVHYDDCERRCMCYNGELLFCHRIRKEFTTMNFEERQRFVQAFKTAATNPIYRDEYRRICKVHSRMPTKLLHHMPQIFLPWHRWYLLEFENLLRQIDCRVTTPYWDWSKDAKHWARTTEESDIWNPGPHGLGGDGILPNGCVRDGPFKDGVFAIPEMIGEGCLKRNFNIACPLPSKVEIQKMTNEENFTTFEKYIRDKIHPAFHDCVGGHMLKHHFASFTPEFWIHHSFIDKLWTDWQIKRGNHTFEYFTNVEFEMPLSGRFPWELLDNHNLPGEIRITYEKPEGTASDTRLENFV
ncbi:hypothetical protein ACROYT_G006634 [Oculina patagonica]